MGTETNPFEKDADRRAIWDMLVRRDIEAFLAADWSMVEDDFDRSRFLGIHAHNSNDLDTWEAAFPEVDTYRVVWLEQAALSAKIDYAEPRGPAIFRATSLSQIDINGDVAVAHKKFDGWIKRRDGEPDRLNWQTLYYCRRSDGRWKITGFLGYLPYR